jgi:adenine-specific DNA-methyltransferase
MNINGEKELPAQISKLQKEIDRLKKSVKQKKYGLVWMDVPEAFEDDVENKLPILKEVPEKAIVNKDGKPTHILIEGDNYHALTCLNYTHKDKIDVIYIDPPYNRGNDGFRYKDKRVIDKFPDGTEVPKDHPFRHSYWLSFMRKRLELSKDLLKDTGVIIISIDDNELSQLKLVCDEIFSSNSKEKAKDNFIACLPTVMNLKGNNDEFGFSGTHEYTLVYAKNKQKCKLYEYDIDEGELEKWEEDEIGSFKKGAPLKATGAESNRENRPSMFYPILYHPTKKTLTTISNEEHSKIYNKDKKEFNDKYLSELKKKYEKEGHVFILPEIDGKYARWRWGWSEETKRKLKTDVIILENGNYSLYKKQRPEIGELPSKKPKSLFYKPEYSSGNGTSQLRDILGDKKFDNPKPLELIRDLLRIGSSDKSIILDFFAGSGTTAHAVLDLNSNDNLYLSNKKSYRQFILITNDEKNIMSEVCYPRVKKVISGYKNRKEEVIEGLGNSLKYYKTAFIGKNNILKVTDEDKIELAHQAGDLLALAENTLYKVKENKFWQIHKNGERYTAVYFREELDKFEEFVEMVEKLKCPITVYVFSWGDEEFAEEFEHIDGVKVKTIPLPILEIYKNIYNLG